MKLEPAMPRALSAARNAPADWDRTAAQYAPAGHATAEYGCVDWYPYLIAREPCVERRERLVAPAPVVD